MNTDNILISHFLGPKAVTPYAVTFKIYWMGIMAVNMIGSVLWPMYAKAKGEGRWDWINNIYNMSFIGLACFGGALWVGGIVFSEDIIKIWAGPEAYGGLLLVIALGGYGYAAAFVGNSLSILNALNPTNSLVLIGWCDAILNLVLSIFLINFFGIAGVGLGTVMAITIAYFFVPKHYVQRRTKNKVNLDATFIVKHAIYIVIPFVLLAIAMKIYITQVALSWTLSLLLFSAYIVLSCRLLPEDFKLLVNKHIPTHMLPAQLRCILNKLA